MDFGNEVPAALLCDAWTGTFSRLGGLDARRSYGREYCNETTVRKASFWRTFLAIFSNASYTALAVLYTVVLCWILCADTDTW